MSFEKFRVLLNFGPDTERADIVRIMSQCAKAVASIRQFEQVGTRRKELLTGSWTVFPYVSVTAKEVIYEKTGHNRDLTNAVTTL
jgi:hypothetical protein